MRNAVYAILFLALTAESFDAYNGQWQTFMKDVGDMIFPASAIKAPLLDLSVVVLLLIARTKPGAQTKRAKPMDQAILTSLGAIAFWEVWGTLRGGNSHVSLYQLKPAILGMLFALLLIAVLKTASDFEGLGKVILASAIFRATTGLIFWSQIVPTLKETPPFMTTHGDSVLFVMGIVLVLAYALEVRTTKSIIFAILVTMMMILIIQLNNRRLAWVSLVGALMTLYFCIPKGRVKKKVNRGILLAIPIFALYVGAGWNSSSPIFKPVKSFQTIGGEKQDSSTMSRNNENKGLVTTFAEHWILGSGWGHEYIEVDASLNVADLFPLYRYIPHNSVLGILAFTGFVGFFAHWVPFPVSAYLCSRGYRASKNPIERAACSAAIAQIVVCTNQIYGDMGYISTTGMYIAATGFAVAGRLSMTSGGWYEGKRKV